MMNFKINNTQVGDKHPCYIIAEIGMNHNGDINLGKKMIQAALNAGANAVKFQSFLTEKFLNKDFFDFEERKKYELNENEHIELKEYANDIGIDFFSTPLDITSLDLLDKIGVGCFKIASCDLNNLDLIEKISKKGKPVIFSTGYAKIHEIHQAYNVLRNNNCPDIGIMHCMASYPTSIENMNLNNLSMLQEMFPLAVIGYSDHSLDYELFPPVAVAMGAKIIEKHFTINRDLPGYDHSMSLNPDMFSKMVSNIRKVEESFGESRDLHKGLYECESERRNNARRSLHWSKNIKKGQVIDESSFINLRPGKGIPPEFMKKFIGLHLTTDVKAHSFVEYSDISR
jgi:sialic acid synthase SpsE